MNQYKRLMIGLDFTTMDETLIEYVAFISYYFKPETIYFVNVQEELEISPELKEKYPELDSPIDEHIEHEMKRKVEKHFPEYLSYEVHFEAVEGSPKKELLHRTHVKNIDLVIVGRKKQSHGSGIIPRQLARKIPCSILFVPDNVSFSLRKILVPVDFSPYSEMAADTATQIAKVDNDVELIFQHVYKVPYGYYKTGKTEEEFATIMKQHAVDKCDEFVEKIGEKDITIHQIYTYDHERKSPAKKIHEAAGEQDVDMIIIGARGRNAATVILLGSVAEKLLDAEIETTIWIIKQKNQSFNFLDVIDAL